MLSSIRRRDLHWPIVPIVAVSALVFAVRASPPATLTDPTTDVVVRLCLIVVVAAGVLTLAWAPAEARPWVTALLAGAFLAAAATIVLSATPFPLNGTSADQGFRLAQVERFRVTWSLADFAYRGLPAFYPPLFFWILGRAAAVTNVPSYEALKFGMVAVSLVLPFAVAGMWSFVTRRRALVVAIILVTLVLPDWWEPYAWLAAALFVPWWLTFVLQVGRDRPLSRRQLGAGSVIGAVALMLYHYWFFVGVVHLVGLLAFRRWGRRHSLELPPARPRQTVLVLAGTAILSSVYWLPLGLSILTTPGSRSMQNRFYGSFAVPIPTRFLNFDLVGVVMAFGLLYLLLTARRSAISFGLLTLFGAVYAWVALGLLGVLLDTPLATQKLEDLTAFVLLTGAAFGLVEGITSLLRSDPVVSRVGRNNLVLTLAAGATILAIAFGQQAVSNFPSLDAQRKAKVPTTLIGDIVRGTRGHYGEGVMLTDIQEVNEYLGVHLFNVWNIYYSHPAGLFEQRARFLQRLSTEQDPNVVATALAANRYDHVEWIALHRKGDAFSYTYGGDDFPTGATTKEIVFSAAVFAGLPRQQGSQVTVFRVRTRQLNTDQRAELRRHFPGDLEGS